MPPEEPRAATRRGKPDSLVLEALEEIEGLKRPLSDLLKRLESLEHRVAVLDAPKA